MSFKERIAGRRVLTDRQLNTEPIPDDAYMLCPLCYHEEWVSSEDADASQSLLIGHLRRVHNLWDGDAWGPVLARVKVVAP